MVPNQQPKPEKSKRYLYPLAVLISLAVILSSGSLIGFFYVAWQSRIDLEQSQQKHKQDRADWHQLDQASEAAAKGDYRTCVAKLSDVSAQSPYQNRFQALINACHGPSGAEILANAEKAAAEGRLRDAIMTALQVKKGPMAATAQQRIEVWSRRIIAFATQEYTAPTAKLDPALEKLRAIPQDSPLYETSQSLIEQWSQEWADNSHYIQVADLAIATGDSQRAAQAIEQMTSHPAWQKQRNQQRLKIKQVQQAFNSRISRAEQALRENKPKQAAELARQLPNYQPWHTRKLTILAEVRDLERQLGWQAIAIGAGVAAATIAIMKSVPGKDSCG